MASGGMASRVMGAHHWGRKGAQQPTLPLTLRQKPQDWEKGQKAGKLKAVSRPWWPAPVPLCCNPTCPRATLTPDPEHVFLCKERSERQKFILGKTGDDASHLGMGGPPPPVLLAARGGEERSSPQGFCERQWATLLASRDPPPPLIPVRFKCTFPRSISGTR